MSDPLNPQGWNRYSYVGNDPLTFTDPNGYDFFSDVFGGIADFFSNVFNAVTNFISNNPIAKAVVQIAATLVISVVFTPALATLGFTAGGIAAVSAFGGAAIATGLSGGNLGQVLKAGLIAGATAFAFAGLPSSGALGATFNPVNYAENIAGSAAIGCVSSVASGGSCGSGAAAAAVGSALSPITSSVFPDARTNLGERIGGTLVQATAGGLASVAGGGKFANGAVTAGFQYLATLSLEDARRNAYAEAGNGPNERHDVAVRATQKYYADLGYVVTRGPDSVVVPGFAATRDYDFLVTDPNGGLTTGIEVKTTIGESIALNPAQVEKDLVVASKGGYAVSVDSAGLVVESVAYHAYCDSCLPGLLGVQSATLYVSLLLHGIPVTPGQLNLRPKP